MENSVKRMKTVTNNLHVCTNLVYEISQMNEVEYSSKFVRNPAQALFPPDPSAKNV